MNADIRLVAHGVLLFFLSLLTGLLLVAAPPLIANPRGVLAGHLEGAMNGMFLILVGLFFGRVRLSRKQLGVCRAALLYGCFANWFFTTLAGILGTSESTPIAGIGHHAGVAAEQFILAALVSVALAMVVSVGLLFIGIRRAIGSPAPAVLEAA
jgi:hydroxylaminobenzene mutase